MKSLKNIWPMLLASLLVAGCAIGDFTPYSGQQYAGSISNSSAFTSGSFYNNGFTATTTGTGFSAPLFSGKAQVLAIKWK